MEWSENFRETWERACNTRSRELTLEHLLAALAYDPDMQRLLDEARVNPNEFRSRLATHIGQTNNITTNPIMPTPSPSVLRVLASAEADAESEGIWEITGLDVITSMFSETNSEAVRLLDKIGIKQLHAVSILRAHKAPDFASTHPSISSLIATQAAIASKLISNTEKPPELPKQGVGAHVELNKNGALDFTPPEAIDAKGNNVVRLHSLLPLIQELAQELATELGGGNAPHGGLSARVSAYLELISVDDLNDINFGRLYGSGLRLANAAHAAENGIRNKILPSFDASQEEKLRSLLGLHGSFIMATKVGAEALLDEERYRRRPTEELRYRESAIAVAQVLQERPDLITPAVADHLLGTARNIGLGSNPERSTVAGQAILRNVLIGIASGALGSATFSYSPIIVGGIGAFSGFIGMLAISETVKKTLWFKALTQAGASNVDQALDSAARASVDAFKLGLDRQKKFAIDSEKLLRDAEPVQENSGFFSRSVEWIKKYTP